MITDKKRYFNWLKKTLLSFARGKNVQIFLFGSSVSRDTFYDIDIGLRGEISRDQIEDLKEEFEESTFPYCVDIVDFERVKKSFSDYVFSQPIVWIQH